MSAVAEVHAPVITVIRGRPAPAELAAAVAVLLAAGSAQEPASTGAAALAGPARTSVWADRARAWHVLPRPGSHSWRACAVPR